MGQPQLDAAGGLRRATRWRCRVPAAALLVAVACTSADPGRVPEVPVPAVFEVGQATLLEPAALAQARIELGRRLFFDPSLSADGTISCGSCHLPDRAFSDTVAVSVGVYGRVGTRNAPSILNAGNQRIFFWDGRVRFLEEQVLKPIEDPLEMDRPLAEVIAHLQAEPGMRAAFRRAFGDDPTEQNLAVALATYIRTLRSEDTPFDRYWKTMTVVTDYQGEITDWLSPEAERGLALFLGPARCATCHIRPNFKDDDFHNTGVAVQSGDPGRYTVTGLEAHRGAFRTPSLRNVALTAPYMHDGSIATLEEVIEFYDRGGEPNENLSDFVRPLGLDAEQKADLLAFLQALTDLPPEPSAP